MKKNPNLGEELNKKYGFNIVRQDGSIDKNSLTLVIINEQNNKTDGFNLIDFLNSLTRNNLNIEKLSTEKIKINDIGKEVTL